MMCCAPAPRFCGQEIFGDMGTFGWTTLTGGPDAVDSWLSNTPGTTTGLACRMYGLLGSFTASTSAAVQASLDAVAAFAGACGSLGLPTNGPFPENFVWSPNLCHFLTAEYRPGSIGSAPGNQYTASYKIVFRLS